MAALALDMRGKSGRISHKQRGKVNLHMRLAGFPHGQDYQLIAEIVKAIHKCGEIIQHARVFMRLPNGDDLLVGLELVVDFYAFERGEDLSGVVGIVINNRAGLRF